LLALAGIFGTPRELISDGAPAFISEGFKEFTTVLLGINHIVTAPYHPTAHGIVEREHREILNKTKVFLMDFDDANKDNRSTYIPLVNRILNAHVHSAIGISPYELIFGLEVARDMHMLKSDLPIQSKFVEKGFRGKGPHAYVRVLNQAMLRANDHALINLQDLIVNNHAKEPLTEQQ